MAPWHSSYRRLGRCGLSDSIRMAQFTESTVLRAMPRLAGIAAHETLDQAIEDHLAQMGGIGRDGIAYLPVRCREVAMVLLDVARDEEDEATIPHLDDRLRD